MSLDPFSNLIAKNLVHTVTVEPGATDGSGDNRPTLFGDLEQGDADDYQVSCAIQFKRRRRADSNHNDIVKDVEIIFGPDVIIGIDWVVKDGQNQFGQILLVKGKIDYIEPVQSIRSGIIGFRATASEA